MKDFQVLGPRLAKIILLVTFFCLPAQAKDTTGALRIGLYTGTFDPPHTGHSELAEQAIQELELDILYVLPNVKVEHKPGASSLEWRKAMTEAAFKHLPQARVADPRLIEAHANNGRFGAVETLAQMHPGQKYFRLMGDDSFWGMWEHQELQLPMGFHVVVMQRADSTVKALPEEFLGIPILELKGQDAGLSSTAIRKMLKEGRRPSADQLAPGVWRLIKKAGLYGVATCQRSFSPKP